MWASWFLASSYTESQASYIDLVIRRRVLPHTGMLSRTASPRHCDLSGGYHNRGLDYFQVFLYGRPNST